MNITQLKLFRDIARERSFVRVAQDNHISQPSVSVHIKKLEHELGKKLLVRSPHNVRLTPEGALILSDVKEILRLCDGLKIRSNYSQDELEGNIRIATIYSVGIYELGDFLALFMKAFPKVHINLEFRPVNEIYRLLEREKIDLGIIAFAENRSNIDTTLYSEDEMVIIVSIDHKFSTRKSVCIEQINNERFIAFEQGIPTREAIDNILDKHNVTVDVRMTNNNVYTLKKAVEANIGISIVPKRTVSEEVNQGKLVSLVIKNTVISRPLSLLKLKRTKLNTPLKIFVDKLMDYGKAKKKKSI
ncbi:MAG: LysR family transcriptional regulator [Shewanella sp.]